MVAVHILSVSGYFIQKSDVETSRKLFDYACQSLLCYLFRCAVNDNVLIFPMLLTNMNH